MITAKVTGTPSLGDGAALRHHREVTIVDVCAARGREAA
jgi:hypothetical protein